VSRTRPAVCCIRIDTGSWQIRTRHPFVALRLEVVRPDGV
jgi:hypothetical protein